MVKKNLVFLSYGRESEYLRAIFCIYSFLAWSGAEERNSRLVIYTDQPEFFKPFLEKLEVSYVLLTPELMEEMLDNTGCIHRRKIAVIDLTFKAYPGEDLLFLDSDTFFINSSTDLFNGFAEGKSFMHKYEYTFIEALALFKSFNQGEYPAAFINYISGRSFRIGDREERFSENDFGWNSGVLGLSSGFASYMPDVFKLNDEFFANSRWFISEQLAFGLILQRRTVLKGSDQYVYHYWGKRQKVLIDQMIIDLFDEKSVSDLRVNSSLIKSLTKKWARAVEVDLIAEQAVIALSHKQWKYGTKKAVQVILKSPFDVNIYKELLNAVKST